MALGDNIGNMGGYRGTSLVTEAALLAELNDLKKKNAKEFDDYAKELTIRRLRKEIDEEKKINEKRLDLAEAFQKKRLKAFKKFKDKENSEDFKKWEENEKKKLNRQIENYKKYLQQVDKANKALEQKEKTKKDIFSGSTDIRTKFKSAKSLISEQGFSALADTLISGLADMAKQLDSTINTIAGYQSAINTRLIGSGKRWENISTQLSGVAGVSPYIQTKKLYENVNSLAEKGISYNLEQRAFLETIAEKIATTFHVDNQNLLNLIRIQQSDTTAARLGLEANLNKYFNSMYETTEYLSDAFDGVSQSIYEATAQMTSTAGVGFEYQVQKWLGSLYSVGMSSGAVSNIASALGMLGSGNISGLSGSTGMQNLLVMAASRAGMPYSTLLKGGLTAETTNKLLASMVEYLAEIADSTKENKVVRSQYANIFGLSASDLVAMANLAPSIKSIRGTSLDYGGAMASLMSTAGSIGSRMSIGEMMTNMWSNIQYNMAAGIASNPALYGIWKVANALTDTVGGIALPDIKWLGTGVNLQTTIADLMRVVSLSGGLLSGIGSIIGAGAGGGLNASNMLTALGLGGNRVSFVTRGGGLEVAQSGRGRSSYTYVGNVSGEDVLMSEQMGAEETQSQKLAQVKEEHEDEVTNEIIDNHIVDIYELLASVISNGALTVRNTNYGLTSPGGLF